MALASWERIFLFQGFVVNCCGRFLTESTHQGRRIVTLMRAFVKRFKIKNCTAIIKEKARSDYVQHVCADALVHT